MSMMQKLYKVAGIPRTYWSANPLSVEPSRIIFDRRIRGKKVFNKGSEIQKRWLQKFVDNPEVLSRPYICCVASVPSDDSAMFVASGLAQTFIRHEWRTETHLTTRCWTAKLDPQPPPGLRFLMVHNLTVDTPKFLFSTVRDVLYRNEDAFRLIVCAGTNPVDFMDNYLRMYAHAFFFYEKQACRKRRQI